MARIFGSQLAELIAAAHRDHGVDRNVGRKVDQVNEGASQLDDGTLLDADLVVVGIGVAPRFGLAQSCRHRRRWWTRSLHRRAGHLRRQDIARWPDRPRKIRRNIVHLVVALVEHTGGIHPPLQVFATVNARRSNVLTHRQSDRAARAVYFIGDLSTARGCTDDQDATVGELSGITVLPGGQLHDRPRHPIGKGGNVSDVACPGSDYNRPA